MGDETAQQHGTHPYPGQPLPTPHEELVNLVKENIKLQPGFHIEVLADQLDCARQMVFGADNTLYVGCWTDHVFALKKQGDQWVAKTIIKGLRQPTGIGYLQRQPLRYRHRQDLSLQGYRQQSRQPEGRGRLQRLPTVHLARLEVHGCGSAGAGLVLHSGRPALQRLPDPVWHGAVSPCQPGRGPVGSGCARPAQQRRRRRRSALRPALVLRECARLDGRQHPVRQAQPPDQVG